VNSNSQASSLFTDLINSTFYIEGERKSYIELNKDIAPSHPELKFGRAINPDFEYSPKAVKMQLLEEFAKYPERIMNFLKTSNPETLSKYFSGPQEVQYIISQLSKHKLSDLKDDGALDKFTKMNTINDLVVADHIERTYGIKGVGLTNITDIFNPSYSKNFDVWEVRNGLL
jgi:hypothetical protein